MSNKSFRVKKNCFFFVLERLLALVVKKKFTCFSCVFLTHNDVIMVDFYVDEQSMNFGFWFNQFRFSFFLIIFLSHLIVEELQFC